MDKIQINLLPKEVLEKRKGEQWLAFMLLGLVVMVGALVLVYGVNFVRVSQERTNLDIIKGENEQVQSRIKKIENFEANKNLVESRERLVATAISGKYSWSRFLNNVSLIVPNEVWLQTLTVAKDGSISFSGSALAGAAASGIGHTPVAKWLVHLAELNDIQDVWLSSSTKSDGGAAGSAAGPSQPTTGTVESSATITFETSAKIKSLGAGSSAPAPPAPGGRL
ncbi:MAG: hypothetical protein Q8L35_05940 [Actinomycetota bacterium]|nr:hypothetical protein [Actinomycetota bacterium]